MEKEALHAGAKGQVHSVDVGEVLLSKAQASNVPLPPGHALEPVQGSASRVTGSMRGFRGGSATQNDSSRAKALRHVRAQLMRAKTEVDRQIALGGNATAAGEKRKAHAAPARQPSSKREEIERNRAARLDNLMNQCTAIVKQISKARPREYEVFGEPVDPNKYGCYDYYDVIKNPMDFGTMLQKVKNKEYLSPEEFKEDAKLVFSNCFTYNREGTAVNTIGKNVQADFWNRWQHHNIDSAWQQELNRRADEDNELESLGEPIPDGVHRHQSTRPPGGGGAASRAPQQQRRQQHPQQQQQQQQQRRAPSQPQGHQQRQQQQRQAQEPQYEPLAYEEKIWVSENISLLMDGDRGDEHNMNVLNIVKESGNYQDEDELDMDNLDVKTQNKLHEYVQQHYAEAQQLQQQQGQEDQEAGTAQQANDAGTSAQTQAQQQEQQEQREAHGDHVNANAAQPAIEGASSQQAEGEQPLRQQQKHEQGKDGGEQKHGESDRREQQHDTQEEQSRDGASEPANVNSWMQIAQDGKQKREAGGDGADGPPGSGVDAAPGVQANAYGNAGVSPAEANGNAPNVGTSLWSAFQEKQRVREEKSKERAEVEERERQEKAEEEEQKRKELQEMQEEAKQREEEQRRQREEAEEAERRKLEEQKEEERRQLEQQAEQATGLGEEREMAKQFESTTGGSFLEQQQQQQQDEQQIGYDDESSESENDDDDEPP